MSEAKVNKQSLQAFISQVGNSKNTNESDNENQTESQSTLQQQENQEDKKSLKAFIQDLGIKSTQSNSQNEGPIKREYGQQEKPHPNQKLIDEAMNAIEQSGDFSILLKYLSMNHFNHEEAYTIQGYNALHMAVWKGKSDIVIHLLDQLKIDVDCKAKSNQTALHLACMKGNIVHFKLLLDRGANLESCDSQNLTPLLTAVQFNRIEMIFILRSLGCNLNAKDVNNCSLSHWAAYKNWVEILKLCKKFNLPLNEQDKLGMTPMHRAASSEAKESVRFLLQHSFQDTEVKDNQGRIPLRVAQEYQTIYTSKLLKDKSQFEPVQDQENQPQEFTPGGFSFQKLLLISVVTMLYTFYYLVINTDSEAFTLSIIFHIALGSSLFLFFTIKPSSAEQKGSIEEIEKAFCDPFAKEAWIDIPHIDSICYDCLKPKIKRSFHCYKCEACIPYFDFHSDLISGCIGASNKKQYLAFLFLQSVSWSMYMYFIISRYTPDQSLAFLSLLGYLFHRIFLTPVVFAFIASWLLLIYNLWYVFLYIFGAAQNLTLFELLQTHKCTYLYVFRSSQNQDQMEAYFDNPNDKGWKKNLQEFFLF